MDILGNVSAIFWILLIIAFVILFLVPLLQRRLIISRRLTIIRSIEKQRQSRVITMIHRQETMSLLGFPVARYIDIEDSEQILRAIRLTPDEMPIDLVLHTPAVWYWHPSKLPVHCVHKGKVTASYPTMPCLRYSQLSPDEIVMDPDAVIGPIDPQLGLTQGGYYPAASVLKALEVPNPNRDDQTLILGDIARKAMNQVYSVVYSLVKENMPEDKARELARALSDGRWTHDYPLTLEQARNLGLPVIDTVPREIYSLMNLYPQSGQRRPSVEFIPIPYTPGPRTPEKGNNK